MSGTSAASSLTGTSSAALDGGDSGLRRRSVQAHHDFRVEPAQDEDSVDADFDEEPPTKTQEYISLVGEYMFWMLLAYFAANVLLWMGERFGFISPEFEEWMPARWWHHNSSNLQKELYLNATAGESTMAQFEGLKSWIEAGAGGWVSPKLLVTDYLSERGRYDRRLEVREEVGEDEVLLRLPLSRVLTASSCQQGNDATVRAVAEAQKLSAEAQIELSPWTWISLCMLGRSRQADADASPGWQSGILLKPEYVDATLSYIPIFWDDEDLRWLNGTDLRNIHVLDVHAAIETEYHKLVYLVPSVQESVPLIDFKKWAMLVMSRGETVDLPDKDNESHTSPQLAIMPLIDLVDHHLPLPERPLLNDEGLHKYQEEGSRSNISYNADIGVVVLKAKVKTPSGSAVTVGFGVRSSSDYLLYHGFTMQREWSELMLCTLYTLVELPLPGDLPPWKARFLEHPYRFMVPACPSRRSTPHVLIGAARFLVATDEEVRSLEERAQHDPTLLGRGSLQKDEKFLRHGALEAVMAVCDTAATPPVCRTPLSVESERKAWALVQRQTSLRLAAHATSIEEDERILAEDDSTGSISVNQRHAVIARREEKLVLQRWCSVAVSIADFLEQPASVQELAVSRIPDDEVLENDEPRVRPIYWRRLLDPPPLGDATPPACRVGR